MNHQTRTPDHNQNTSVPVRDEERRQRSGWRRYGWLAGITLIALGFVFLLQDISIHLLTNSLLLMLDLAVALFWPALLIAVGLAILLTGFLPRGHGSGTEPQTR